MGQPQEIGKVISKFLKTSGIEKGIKQRQAVAIWEKVVGKEIAAQAKAIKAENSNLLIRVANPVWRSEILLMKAKILQELNKSLGQEAIKDIILVGK